MSKTKHDDEPKRYKTVKAWLPPCLLNANSVCGNFVMSSLRLRQFIGRHNEAFLTGIVDHFNCHPTKKNIVWFSCPVFEKQYGVNRYFQDKALNELARLDFFKLLTKRGPNNTQRLRINETACFVFTWMANNLKEPEDLPKLFKQILDDEKFQNQINNKIKRIKVKWSNSKVMLKKQAKRKDLPKTVEKQLDEFMEFISDYFY